jgi:hypothetical protein
MSFLDSILERKRIVLIVFLLFLLIELISFFSYFIPAVNTIFFFLLTIIVLFLAIYKIEWSFYVLIGELLFNSMGHVFHLNFEGLNMSIRVSLWLVIMAIFLAKFALKLFKDKSLVSRYTNNIFFNSFFYLSIFILFAFIFGLVRNGFSDAFFDFNSWLYFAIALPLWFIFIVNDKKDGFRKSFWINIFIIFIAAILYLSFKSLLLLFLFSHDIIIASAIYYWTRGYYLGEITDMGNGFYRVFLQAQIFILLGFLIFSPVMVFIKNKKHKIYLFILLSLLASSLILSFSRSFWLGLVLSLALLMSFLWIKFGFKVFLKSLFLNMTFFAIGFLLVLFIVNLPSPNSSSHFGVDSLSERASITSQEAAVSSRWELLEVIRRDLQKNFLLGRGFGARLEYKSSDPRFLQSTADGLYSTYAFEWGWLDIWLKLGFLGMLAYFFLLFSFFKKTWKSFLRDKNILYIGLGLSVFSLIIVNFFTPYLNHPLGIGFLVLSVSFLSFNPFNLSKKDS